MTEKKLAQQLFDAKFASDRVEEEVCEMLWALLGKGGYEDFTFDHYDRSIEIFGVKPDLVLTVEQQQGFWAHGFERCWTHVALERSGVEGDDEKFYAVR